MNIYIAGFWDARDRLARERNRIHARGRHRIVSTWLEQEEALLGPYGGGQAGDNDVLMAQYGQRDVDEIAGSDLLILDTFDLNNRGGREVELGLALAGGAEAWLVGPRRNIFHWLLPQYDSWNAVHRALEPAPPKAAAGA